MTHPQDHVTPGASRRQVVVAGVLAASATALAACGSGTSTGSASPGGAGGSATVPSSEVPVGGGTILTDAAVVVTQPTAGTYEAFSAICPHAGCPVTRIQGGLILCPCHGSQFDITTGDVKAGPGTAWADPSHGHRAGRHHHRLLRTSGGPRGGPGGIPLLRSRAVSASP